MQVLSYVLVSFFRGIPDRLTSSSSPTNIIKRQLKWTELKNLFKFPYTYLVNPSLIYIYIYINRWVDVLYASFYLFLTLSIIALFLHKVQLRIKFTGLNFIFIYFFIKASFIPLLSLRIVIFCWIQKKKFMQHIGPKTIEFANIIYTNFFMKIEAERLLLNVSIFLRNSMEL